MHKRLFALDAERLFVDKVGAPERPFVERSF
jgi:hypothetical protein